MISLLITIASQHKAVFKRYLKNWKTENVVYESALSPNQIGENSKVMFAHSFGQVSFYYQVQPCFR